MPQVGQAAVCVLLRNSRLGVRLGQVGQTSPGGPPADPSSRQDRRPLAAVTSPHVLTAEQGQPECSHSTMSTVSPGAGTPKGAAARAGGGDP